MGWTSERARVASLTRSRADDDPELVAARRNLRYERLADQIANVVSQAPPLTDDQRQALATLLVAGSPHNREGGRE